MRETCASNFAFCNECRAAVPAEHVERDGKVYLRKKCPKCGETETLVSNNAVTYRRKREFMGEIDYQTCALNCFDCLHQPPNIAFVEITNRCNMNCPICITNVPSMGFEFEPDRDYFRLIFEHLAKLPGSPSVQLFGGEPTVREDLFEIIQMARSYGLSVRVTTNGLKLADREYCDRLLEQKASILISFDGFERKLYELFRGMPEALDLKLKALQNLGKARGGKVILMTVASKEQDPEELKKLFAYCLENQHIVRGIFIMPLAHMWSPERLAYDPERTTPEDVEELVNKVIAAGKAEFVPMGSLDLKLFYGIFKWRNAPFVGVHPNCESIAILVSDGQKYLPISAFLKHGFFGLVGDLRKAARRISSSTRSERGKKVKALAAILSALWRHFDFAAAVGKKGSRAFAAWMRILGKLLTGRRLKDVMRQETRMKGILQVIVLPFEDYDTTEGIRLKPCASSFVYPNRLDGDIRYIPVCAWERHKKVVMKKLAEMFNKPGFTKGLSGKRHVAAKS